MYLCIPTEQLGFFFLQAQNLVAFKVPKRTDTLEF